jgi:hypothetical protein
MEEIIKQLGFESLQEWHKLVANVPDLNDPQKLKASEDLKDIDS